MSRLARLAPLAALALAACLGTDASPGHWTPGKGDGSFELVEAGPAPVGGSTSAALDGRVPAYRVESYGGTELAIDLTSADTEPYLVVEGPLAGDGDTVAVGGGPVVAEGSGAHLDLALAKPGVYRILAGSADSLGRGAAPSGTVTLAVSCRAACTRPMIDQKTFVRALQAQAGGALGDLAKQELAQLVPDPQAASQLAAQLDAMLADPDLTGLDRFPELALSQVAALRPALDAVPAKTPAPDQVITGDLQELLGPCTPDRSLPADVDPRLPGVKYAQFPNVTLSPCQFAHAGTLAQILTSLAANNGSSITFEGQTITSPRELFAQLIATGHTIEVRNERMYANFLSAIVGDKDLLWPVWLDTGLQLSTGDSLTIPVGHSQHAWWISGPIVNTRVTFFLGISGAGFFGQTDERPAWSGTSVASDVTVRSPDDPGYGYLMSTADAATAYLQRNRLERTTVAAGMPADGYGYVGVCNDSTAVIESMARGTDNEFPLLRAAALDQQPDVGDGLDDVLRALPKDGDGLPDPQDALRRAVAMQPFPDGSPLVWDATLGAQIATARADLAR